MVGLFVLLMLTNVAESQRTQYAEVDEDLQPERIRCDSCVSLMIQGIFCHEIDCPNTNSRYDAEADSWVMQRKCFECGYTVDRDDPCCSAEEASEID
jgi:hypothetical protein